MQTGGAGADCRILTALLGGRQEGCVSSVQHVLVEHLLCVRWCHMEKAYGMNRTRLLLWRGLSSPEGQGAITWKLKF